MKLATIRYEHSEVAAIVDPEASLAWPLGRSMLDVITSGELPEREGKGIPLSEAVLLAPIPRPSRNIFCIGKNYRDHVAEMGSADDAPSVPIVFSKLPETVIAHEEAIRIGAASDAVDYEAELAVIIGRGGRGISRADAFAHVFGYTIVNDVTARDLQKRHQQWLIGKSQDTFCPMGPWIVTADEIDPTDTSLSLWVNDERRQHASTRDLIFDLPTIIEEISAGITLYPGDIIATGTPSGVGAGFRPPRFLKRGDRVTIEIQGIGRLSNPVV